MGCTKNEEELVVHENVDEELAKDSVKALEILDKKIKKNNKPKFKEEDADFLNNYITTYAPKKAYKQSPKRYQKVDPPFTTDDFQIYLRTETQIFSFGPKALVDEKGNYINGTSNFNWQKEDILDIIENGFVPSESAP